MSDNWIVQNLNSALSTWSEKMAELWTLSKIKPIARISEKIKVDRLLITDNGSPAANAVVAPTVTVSTSAI